MEKKKLPKFVRQNRRMARVKDNWRKPHGIDNKLRIKKGGYGALPKIGFRNAKAIRDMHPCGMHEKLVNNLDEAKNAGKNFAIRLGATVGEKKRKLIRAEAKKLGLKILN